MKMFHLKNDMICCFLHQEYQSKGQDWHAGDTWCCFISDSINLNEETEMNKIKKKS